MQVSKPRRNYYHERFDWRDANARIVLGFSLTSVYENLLVSLKSLPGLGYRSAEKIAIHLLVERRTKLDELIELMGLAAERLKACEICGNLAEGVNC